MTIARQLGVAQEALSTEQLYAYLLRELHSLDDTIAAEALRNAYAVGQEGNPRSLTYRRTDFAAQHSRHADTVKAYENQAIRELALCLEKHGGARLTHGVVPTAADTSQLAGALQRTAAESLAGLYPLGSHASEIVRCLGRPGTAYLNVNLECTMTASSRGEGWYSFKYRYTFQSSKQTFRVGITAALQDTRLLMDTGIVDEVIQVSSEPDFNKEVAHVINHWRFIVHNSVTNTRQHLWFSEIDTDARRELLHLTWQVSPDECRIVEVYLPQETESCLYELQTVTDLEVDDCYAYWEAPCLMYVNSVTVDVSQFPHRDRWQFFFIPFLGTTFPAAVDASGSRFTLPAGSWIVPGQGMAIIWKKA